LKNKEGKMLERDLKNIIYEYGCENKRYTIIFYRNMTEKEDKYGNTYKVIGIVKNFNPMGQTAINDDSGDLWLIDSRLISVMKPASKFDKMKEKEI
jgi:cytochrome oxidase Cu insertion factor (SCO1/SenC/PrrC family)